MFDFLPSLAPDELLFTLLVFIAALFLLFNIQPVMIMGGVLLLTIMWIVELKGMTPMTMLFVLITLAIVRILADAVNAGRNADPETQAMMLRALDIITGHWLGNDDDDDDPN